MKIPNEVKDILKHHGLEESKMNIDVILKIYFDFLDQIEDKIIVVKIMKKLTIREIGNYENLDKTDKINFLEDKYNCYRTIQREIENGRFDEEVEQQQGENEEEEEDIERKIEDMKNQEGYYDGDDDEEEEEQEEQHDRINWHLSIEEEQEPDFTDGEMIDNLLDRRNFVINRRQEIIHSINSGLDDQNYIQILENLTTELHHLNNEIQELRPRPME